MTKMLDLADKLIPWYYLFYIPKSYLILKALTLEKWFEQ